MRRFEFTENQRRIIALERYCHPNPRVQRRMEMQMQRRCRCGKREKSFRRGNGGGVWRPIFKQQRAIGRLRRASADSSTAARPRG